MPIPKLSYAGISVVGTRFVFNDKTTAINIRVLNDDENDYLIKTEISDQGFIISPPLFLLKKDSSNIITIIPNEIVKMHYDQDYDLVITSIPKSENNEINNTVALAVRSHFKLIYRHNAPVNDDFKKIVLEENNYGKYFLINQSKFIFNISLSIDDGLINDKSKLFSPNQKISVDEYCTNSRCNLWLNIIDDNYSLVKKINFTSN